MAMQTLHQELEQPQQDHRVEAHPALRGLVADQATAYAEEVRVLRQRVALLESELAAAKLAKPAPGAVHEVSPQTTGDGAVDPTGSPIHQSEFTEPTAPAVMVVAPAETQTAANQTAAYQTAATQTAATQTVASQTVASQTAAAPVGPSTTAPATVAETASPGIDNRSDSASDPGFAEAWSAEDPVASFEERVAERAFFHASTVDQESRTWLLAQ